MTEDRWGKKGSIKTAKTFALVLEFWLTLLSPFFRLSDAVHRETGVSAIMLRVLSGSVSFLWGKSDQKFKLEWQSEMQMKG